MVETIAIEDVFTRKNSLAHQLLYAQLTPELPSSFRQHLSDKPTEKPVLRLCFEGKKTTAPFISQVSRDLQLDINILVANIDRFHGITCGVLFVEITATQSLLKQFIQRCESAQLTVEILGYVTNDVI